MAVAIDRDEIPGVQAERIAVWTREADLLDVARGMHIHDNLQSRSVIGI
jgi:hypothetical protein